MADHVRPQKVENFHFTFITICFVKRTNMEIEMTFDRDLHDPYVPLYYLCMMTFSLKRTGARLLTNKDDITFNIICWKMEFLLEFDTMELKTEKSFCSKT